MSETKSNLQKNLSSDLMASMVLFIIAVPLSLGIAMASGTSSASAIIAIVVGGFIVGSLSGAPLVVSGPAAGLSALIFQFVTQYGTSGLVYITVLAGSFQILLGLMRGAGVIRILPKTILEGVLSAIGFVIIIGQLHVLLGQSIPGGPIHSLMTLPNAFNTSMNREHFVGVLALAVGALAIVLQLAWKTWAPKSLKIIPPALPAVIIATLVSLPLEIPKIELHAINSFATESLNFFMANVSLNALTPFLIPALALAFVASAESLLTATAIELLAQKHQLVSRVEFNRELIAQGFGNLVSGIFGGLPLSGVMVRSAANVESGGRTRRSTIFHALWVISFVIFFPHVVELLPSTALASVLILTGFKLINMNAMLHSVKNNIREAYLWPVTAIAIVSTDLLWGLLIGILIAIVDHGMKQFQCSKNT